MNNSSSRFSFLNYINSDFQKMVPDSSFWAIINASKRKSKGCFELQLKNIAEVLSKRPFEQLIVYYVKYIGFKILIDTPYWYSLKMTDFEKQHCLSWIILQSKRFYTKWREGFSQSKRQSTLMKNYRKMKTDFEGDPFITIINQLFYNETGYYLFDERILSETDFWRIINRSLEQSGGCINQMCRFVENELRKLSLHQIIIFYRLFIKNRILSYKWDLYQAFKLITNYHDEDSFDSFRNWLLGQGETFFKGKLDDPDSLAELKIEELMETLDSYDWLEVLPQFIFKERTGEPLWDEEERKSYLPQQNWAGYEVYLSRLTAKYKNKS